MAMQSETMNLATGAKKTPFDDLGREDLITKCKGLLVIAQKAKQAKTELQAEVDNFKMKLEKCETEKKACTENFSTLQELIDSLTEQKLNLITEVDAARSQINGLNQKCFNYEEQINHHKASLILKDNNISDITQKLSNLDCEIISLKRQNHRLTEENEQLINQLTEIEAKATEVNNIGLQQREQLQLIEETVEKDKEYNKVINELNQKIKHLEGKLDKTVVEYDTKIKDLMQSYESEKIKKEKANVKLKCYKDKILKCAACINQLKNSRFILTKTVKEYSDNIPKWQNDILKASRVLEEKVLELNSENNSLKEKLLYLEKQLDETIATSNINNFDDQETLLNKENNHIESLKLEISKLKDDLKNSIEEKDIMLNKVTEIKLKYDKVCQQELPKIIKENNVLIEQKNIEITKQLDLLQNNKELRKSIEELEIKNKTLSVLLQNQNDNSEAFENLNLQVKALESEKSILVKEKMNARDHILDLENQLKYLSEQNETFKSHVHTLKAEVESMTQEKILFENKLKHEKEGEISLLKSEIMKLEEQLGLMKKEHDDVMDLNGLLREEVETLKLSLEQPKDETDNLSDLNVSLQADIVKLESKLSAYKQENSSLLTEVKELRNKVKEYDTLFTDYEDAKSKLLNYKSENAELLNEMKEINQVLKERGESISKLQKAIAELEKLVETLEKDRDEVKIEKTELVQKIESMENELQLSKQKMVEDNNVINKISLERDNAIKDVNEKLDIIDSLKEDLERMKQITQNPSTGDLPNEDMSTSTISKADDHARMKDLDETFEEKYSKLRLFALKLKKRHNEIVTELEETRKEKSKLEKLVNEGETKQISNTETQTQESMKLVSAAVDEVNSIKAQLEKVQVELDAKKQQLASEIDAHKLTMDNLEKAKRDVKKRDVLSLEMEDYERSMKELTVKMEENKKKMVQMESTIDTQEGTMTAMKTQIKLLEEQIRTEETQNRLVKEELQHSIEEGKEKDNVILVKNGIISKLEQELEDEKRKNEESDIEVTLALAEKEKVVMTLGEEKAELNNRVKKLEFKCAELNESLKIVNIELADLKTEYTSYKVRAQAVLRQNQTVDHSQEEQLKEEAAALRAQIETLTVKLQALEAKSSEQSVEIESARRRAADATAEASRAHQRTARLQADLTRISQQMESERTQHKLQVSTLTQCYKTQISELETKLQKETENLKKQLLVTAANTGTGKASTRPLDEANPGHYMIPVLPKDDNSDGEMDINVSMIPREEGEGSESAPSPPPSKAFAGGNRSPVPLERLLEDGVPEDEMLDATSLALTPEQEIADLKRRLGAQQQRVKHVTLLLSESERECARMAQLSDLLKAELRRSRATSQNVHNTEYMKNVTLKFLTLSPGDERSRLVPVLQKILSLTQDETHKIQAIAKGLDPSPTKGWGSYLPWPGGK